MEKLNKCPFCGGFDVYLTFDYEWDGFEMPVVFCNWCKVSLKPEDNIRGTVSDEEAKRILTDRIVKIWNERGSNEKRR